MRERDNIFDGMLVVMMSLIVFGLIGNALQPIRLFIMALAPFMVIDTIRTPEKNVSYFYGYECFFFIIWWLYAAAFLFKAADMVESAKQLVYLLIHMLGFLEVLWLSLHAHNPQRSVAKGWICMLVLSLPIAFYELITDFHLPMSVFDSGLSMKFNGVVIERRFAAVTFGNLNSYNTILCWMLPFLFIWILYPTKKKDKLIGTLLLLLTMFVIIANSSRGAILCLSMLLAFYILCYFRNGNNKIFLLTTIITVTLVLVYYLIDIFLLITERFSTQGFEDDGRSENITKGIQSITDNYGLGIGIGNYEPVMGNVYRVDIPAPHNLLLEVIVEYGIFIFIGFIAMMIHLFLMSRRGTKYNRTAAVFCFIAFVFAGIIDSTYLMKVPTWMFLASLYVFSDEQYNQSKTT